MYQLQKKGTAEFLINKLVTISYTKKKENLNDLTKALNSAKKTHGVEDTWL